MLIIIMLPAVLLVNFYAWSGWNPFSTELTRVGGFPEEDFGWFGTEYRFAEPPVETIGEGGVYEKYTDMVVFGDSFSLKEDSNWVFHFVNATGLSAQSMYYYHGGIERLVETDLYRSRPPRVVVYEVVERLLKDTFRDSPVDCNVLDTVIPLPAVSEPLNIPLLGYERDMSRRYGDYQLGIKILRNKLNFLAGRGDKLKARVASLTVDSLFSNRKSGQLLYIGDDLKQRTWPDDVPQKVLCGLNSIRERVEANGYTAFVVMFAPDKFSVYTPWLADDGLAHLSVLESRALTGIPHSLGTRARAVQAIEQGFVDFYIPGGTHWSSKGDMQVAQWMVELFQADSALHH